jgi:serine protease DegQ
MKRTRTWAPLLALAAVLAVAAAGCSLGDDGARPDVTQAGTDQAGGLFARIPDIVQEVQPSVVAVLTERGQGSGVVWSSDGVVVTNHHVIAGAERIRVAFADGRRSPARVQASDPATDLAVLRSERTGLPAASFASRLPAPGELAIAIGNPLGFANSVTVGVVSGLHRGIPGSAGRTLALVDLIQTDAAISPGNSGGALVGPDGELIGVNEAYIPPAAGAVSLGFAIPAPTVVDVVEQLLADGEVSHPFVGIRTAPLTPQIAERFDLGSSEGALVLEVEAGSPADAAGMRPGDVITSVDGTAVRSVEDFLGQLRRREPGDRIGITVLRAGQEQVLQVTLTERPD